MNTLRPEQISAAQKAGVDSFFNLANKLFEGVEKVIELNLQTARAALAETSANTARIMLAKDPNEWCAVQATFAGPYAEQVQSYGRHLLEIASSVQAEFLQLAQARYEEHNRRVQKLVDDVTKSAPAGSEAMIAAWKSAITSSATLSESLQRTAQQTAEIAESSLKVLTEAGSKVAAPRTNRQVPGATTH